MAVRPTFLCIAAAIALVAGCRTARQVRDPEYARVSRAVQAAWCAPQTTVVATAPVLADLAGPHPVEQYIQIALSQNPEIQAARKKMESLAHQVPVAASLPDPMLNVTAQPEPVQTAAGQQELIVAASQKFLLFGKLGTRAYARELRDHLRAAIGYGLTGALSPESSALGTPGIGELRRSLRMRPAHMVTASVSTEIARTGTRIITSYQWLNRQAVIATDLYNDFAARSDPGLNVVIRQPLPFGGSLPGKLEATADFRNLLKAGYVPIQTHDGQQMYLLQAIRSYRGALSFIF